jgi:hypothetical protein
MSQPEHASRFLSSAVDWRHVATGILIGAPAFLGGIIGFQRVTDFAVAALRDEGTKAEARTQRQLDEIRQDVRDLRARLDHQQQERGGR